MIYSKIKGTGSYLPANIFTNEDWAKRVDTTDEWIVERTGIRSRHIAARGETTAGMGVKAAHKALEMAGCSVDEIDMIIATTGSPDQVFPACACMIQEQLGARLIPAFDLQAACSGFVYAMTVADQFIKSGSAKKVLVVSTEMLSRLIDWNERDTCVLFGDGAGAVVLEASSEPGILSTKIQADGACGHMLKVDNMQLADFSRVIDSINETDNLNAPIQEFYPHVKMKGRQVFKTAVQRLGELVTEVMNDPNLQDEPIDWLVPHQANIRIIQATAQKLDLPMDKVICTVETHSNTSSASIPLALDTAIRDGRIKRGQNLLLEAFGGGLTWGSCFVKF